MKSFNKPIQYTQYSCGLLSACFFGAGILSLVAKSEVPQLCALFLGLSAILGIAAFITNIVLNQKVNGNISLNGSQLKEGLKQ
jgi:hypothetical protein